MCRYKSTAKAEFHPYLSAYAVTGYTESEFLTTAVPTEPLLSSLDLAEVKDAPTYILSCDSQTGEYFLKLEKA